MGATGRLLQRLRPRSAGLRQWLGLTYGVLAVGLVALLAWRLEHMATRSLEEDIGLRLEARAQALASRVDRGLFERLNDMRAMALLPGMDDPLASESTLRDLFDLMQLNYPDFVWIGATDAQGRVLVANRGLLEGVDVSARPWFAAARKEPYVGDIHEAALLSKLITRPGGEPLRLIDVAAPIHDDHGEVTGVLGAHLSWRWAEGLVEEQTRPSRANDPVDVIFIDSQGRVTLGPEALLGTVPDLPSVRAVLADQRGAVRETWPDGDFLVGYVQTNGHDIYGRLGWSVLVRKQAELALQPVAELSRQIWLASAVLLLAFLLVSTLMARLIGTPLHSLAVAARRIQAREPGAAFPPERGYREARELTGAMRSLVDDLTTHEHELMELTTQLEQRVRERTQALSEANAQLEVLAMTDALTGLANRRHFGDQLAREATRAAETGRPMSLLVMDIDHFKSVNDKHGHPAGDAVLRHVALLLEEQVRGSDLLARVGGEEFAVLAVDTAMVEAGHLAERLRRAVEQAGPVSVGHAAVAVTISLGVVSRRIKPGDLARAPEHLLAAADDALYRAKRNGRNRVEVAVG